MRVFTVTMVKYRKTPTVDVVILHVLAEDGAHAARRASREGFFGIVLTVFEGEHRDLLSLLPPVKL